MFPQENLNFQNLRNFILGILARYVTITEALITTLKSILFSVTSLTDHTPPPLFELIRDFRNTNQSTEKFIIDSLNSSQNQISGELRF